MKNVKIIKNSYSPENTHDVAYNQSFGLYFGCCRANQQIDLLENCKINEFYFSFLNFRLGKLEHLLTQIIYLLFRILYLMCSNPHNLEY